MAWPGEGVYCNGGVVARLLVSDSSYINGPIAVFLEQWCSLWRERGA